MGITTHHPRTRFIMGKIEWTDRTWNPLAGCTMVSRACVNCYAMRMAFRLEHMGQEKYKGTTRKTEGGKIVWTGKINIDEKALLEPLKWKKPQRVFVNSMSDLFHEDVDPYFVDKVFAVMAATPHITYQILTKRPDRVEVYFNDEDLGHDIDTAAKKLDLKIPFVWPLPNVWLGTTIENQKEADKRIPPLLNCPAAVRFVSCEPLVGPIEFSNVTKRSDAVSQLGKKALNGIHWVIAGGESGPNAEPSHPDWFRSLRDQCESAGVPFFFKQWGEWIPSSQLDNRHVNIKLAIEVHKSGLIGKAARDKAKQDKDGYIVCYKIGKKVSGTLLDFKVYNEIPDAGRNEGEK
jgi:protein gp37